MSATLVNLMVVMESVYKAFPPKNLLPFRKSEAAKVEPVLKDISMVVPKGEIYGLLGPSGSGKTTTMRMMLGTYFPTSGRVEVMGTPPNKWNRELQAKIGYVPQLFVLYPDLTVRQNMEFIASVYAVPLAERRKRIPEVLDLVELTPAQNRPAGKISGGMQRRLSIAAALIHQPPLLFVDEPTAGIDPILRAKIWDEFRRLKQEGTTLFVTTQYVNEADLCDRVGIMNRGELIANGTPDELREQAFAGESQVIDVTTASPLPASLPSLGAEPLVKSFERLSDRRILVRVQSSGRDMEEVVQALQRDGVAIEQLNARSVEFDDVFLRIVNEAGRRVHAGIGGIS